jgi:hypothetical protein
MLPRRWAVAEWMLSVLKRSAWHLAHANLICYSQANQAYAGFLETVWQISGTE